MSTATKRFAQRNKFLICFALAINLAAGLAVLSIERLQSPSAQSFLPAPKLVSPARHVVVTQSGATPSFRSDSEFINQFIYDYCIACHNDFDQVADLDLEHVDFEDVESAIRQLESGEVSNDRANRLSEANLSASDLDAIATWERIARKLLTRQMPPPDADIPDAQVARDVLEAMTHKLDRLAILYPMPGETPSLKRLTRTEYSNAIRDLLDIAVDGSRWFPAESSSHGFDNVSVGELSPTLLERYLTAAEEISEVVVGKRPSSPMSETYRVPADRSQSQHVDGLPFGTRGGDIFSHHFPVDGVYEFSMRLTRDRNEHVEGLRGRHTLLLLVDGEEIESFSIGSPEGRNDHSQVDAHLKIRIPISSGEHEIGVTFLQRSSSLLETRRQPYEAQFNMHRHPRHAPALYQMTIDGPFPSNDVSPHDDHNDGIERLMDRYEVSDDASEDEQALQLLSRLMRRAYRRPITSQDLENVMTFYSQGKELEGFSTGLEHAIRAILVNPNFVFRIESNSDSVFADGERVVSVSDFELATRLSFFLWSSIPDDELLKLASSGQLSEPEILDEQVVRMLQDSRASALVTNFAGQWLFLPNVQSVSPNFRQFTDFDDNLRQAFITETELFIESTLREDRSVLDLIKSDYTYLNERLAKHYGIDHIYGSRFRRVELPADLHRGGILRHGSILSLTSYSTRTSPVIRGNWVLENLLGTPAPPPPADVPALDDNHVDASLTIRERLNQHRADAACAGCHRLMDPIGFALENYDAIGRWRMRDEDHDIDASGATPDGRTFVGVDGLETALLEYPEIVVTTLTEKLLTYALGRGLTHHDGYAVRNVVRQAAEDDYRWSALVQAIVRSSPFNMRMAE